MAKSTFLKLIVSLTALMYQESQSLDNTLLSNSISQGNNDKWTFDQIKPALIQIKNLQNKLDKFTIPQLCGLYVCSQKEIGETIKMVSMKQELMNCKTIKELLKKNCRFLRKYHYNLKQLLNYQMENSPLVDLKTKIANRQEILSKLEGYLTLTQTEMEICIHGAQEDNNEIQKLLFDIPTSGDFSYMIKLDIDFALQLSWFVNKSINEFENKLSANN